MEAIRRIICSDSEEITLTLPKDLVKRMVEIIILPLDSPVLGPDRFSTFLSNQIEIPGFKMPSREERNAR